MKSTLERTLELDEKIALPRDETQEESILFNLLVEQGIQALSRPLRSSTITQQLGLGYGLPKLSKKQGLVWTDGSIIHAYLPGESTIRRLEQGYHIVAPKALEARATLQNPQKTTSDTTVSLRDVRRIVEPRPYFGMKILQPSEVQEIYRNESL